MLRSIKLGLLVSLIGVSSFGCFGMDSDNSVLEWFRRNLEALSSSKSSAEQSPAAVSFGYNFLNWVADKAKGFVSSPKVKGFVSSPKAWGVVLTGVAVWQVKRWWDMDPTVFDSVKNFARWANRFSDGWLPFSLTKFKEVRHKDFLAKSERIFDSQKLLSSTICGGIETMKTPALLRPFSLEGEGQNFSADRFATIQMVFIIIGDQLVSRKIFEYGEDESFKQLENQEDLVELSQPDWIPDGRTQRNILGLPHCLKMIELLENEVALLDTHLKRIWDRFGLGEVSILDNAKTAENLGGVQNPLVKDVLVKGLEKREQAKALIQVINSYRVYKNRSQVMVDTI